jgi:hypothetical protein
MSRHAVIFYTLEELRQSLRNTHKILVGNLIGQHHLEDLSTYWRIIFKYIPILQK